MPPMDVVVRAALPEDPAHGLLFDSAAPYYSAYAGGPERARRLLRALYPRERHTASWDVCFVAELGGELVGVIAAFPSDEGDELARRFVRLTLRHSPPWRIPALFRHLRATAAVSPHPPRGMLYVDALATDPAHRRRGVATALLADAERRAQLAGLKGLALDTGIENRAARALYEHYGFTQRGLRPAPDDRTARAVGGSGFVGYVKPR
jgi:ribosomal protein S18 acetylase RimI-like enzyme